MSEDMSPYCSAHDEWLIMKLCMYVGYHDANNVSNFGGDPIKFKKGFCLSNWAHCYPRGVAPFNEEQQYGRPYQPKHRPSNYCPLIWHFCNQTNTKKLEKIQERALRFIYNNYSSTHNDLLRTAGTQYLHVKRLKRMACKVFKIINNISLSFTKNLIELKTSKYSMRRTKPAVVPKSKTSKYGLNPLDTGYFSVAVSSGLSIFKKRHFLGTHFQLVISQ